MLGSCCVVCADTQRCIAPRSSLFRLHLVAACPKANVRTIDNVLQYMCQLQYHGVTLAGDMQLSRILEAGEGHHGCCIRSKGRRRLKFAARLLFLSFFCPADRSAPLFQPAVTHTEGSSSEIL